MTEVQSSVKQVEGQECGYCQGKGFNWDVHVWSDGPGQVQATCPLCKGSGVMEDDHALLQRLVKAERERTEAKSKLAHLRTYLALFRMAKRGEMPKETLDPNRKGYILTDTPEAKRGTGLALAPYPSPHASTWAEHIQHETELAPRYDGDYNDYLESLSQRDKQARPGKRGRLLSEAAIEETT